MIYLAQIQMRTVALLQVLTLAFWASTLSAIDEQPFFEEQVVISAAETGYLRHQISVLLVTRSGSVLIASDARYVEGGDNAPHDVVYRRSSDGGTSWDPLRWIENGMAESTNQIWSHPALGQDRVSGKIFMPYALKSPDFNSTQNFIRESGDDGASFGERIDITTLLREKDPLQRSSFYPYGHAIQLSGSHHAHPNRILFALLAIGSHTEQTGFGVGILFTDDGGVTWDARFLPSDLFLWNESRLIELSNGDILVNSRVHEIAVDRRTVALSSDGGDSWSPPRLDYSSPRFFKTDAGMIRLSSANDDPHGLSRILLSYPNSIEPWQRKRMTVAVSYDETKTWSIGREINPNAVSYSDLGVLPDKTIVLVYGIDPRVTGTALARDQVVARFNLPWLTDNTDSISEGRFPFIINSFSDGE